MDIHISIWTVLFVIPWCWFFYKIFTAESTGVWDFTHILVILYFGVALIVSMAFGLVYCIGRIKGYWV